MIDHQLELAKASLVSNLKVEEAHKEASCAKTVLSLMSVGEEEVEGVVAVIAAQIRVP